MGIWVMDDEFDREILAGTSCAFGVFDGLHLGHRFLLDEVMRTAGPDGRSIALTFDIDPDEVFHPDRLSKLMTNADRLAALAASGVDDVVVLPFTEEFRSRDPEAFLAYLFPDGAPAHLHVGEDFRFGARAAGTVETLRTWASNVGCDVHAHSLVSADGKPITSTRIRLLLLDGKSDEAARLLGHAPA